MPDPDGTTETAIAPPPEAIDVALPMGAKVDRYTVLERVGEGAAGAVYAAYDPKLDRKVALKVLRFSGLEYEARLLREAQAMARLSHPNVVSVYDTGVVDDRLFLAMEFVEGRTLRKWQRAEKPGWSEALSRYLEAGRGLAAAHAAGLVHRDFKPDNVLVAKSGAVKVTDFGIVRATGEAGHDAQDETLPGGVSEDSEVRPAGDSLARLALRELEVPRSADSNASLDTPMTEEGSLLGTPGYMAPEQYLFEPVDARTDQFAFAVSLYEALYGERPFPGHGVFELGRATLEGKIREAPKGSAVPQRLRRVLLRALAAEPRDRYPSLDTLLAELARDPAKQRRRALYVVAAVLVAVGGALAVQRAILARSTGLCSGAEALAGEVWNPGVRREAERAMLATGLPFAADTWARTRADVDGYVARWTAMHRETCEATRVRGEQSELVMSARMACLEQARRGVGGLADVLRTGDRESTSRAVLASLALPALARCKDVTSLVAIEPEPTDPAARAELAAIETGVAAANAQLAAGRVAAAREQVEPLITRARALGYRPLFAEVLLASAVVKAEAGASRDASILEATEALFQADVGHADVLRAKAATRLMTWTTDAGHRVEAEQWSRIAEAALDRAHDDGDARAAWLVASAWAAESQGKYQEAKEQLQAALSLARRAGMSPERIADTERLLAGKLAAIGEADEAKRLVTEASESIRRAVGDDHPSRIPYLLTLGYVAGERADYAAGLATTREAIALAERISPDHNRLPLLYSNESNFLFELHDYPGALASAEKATAVALRVFGADGLEAAYGHSDAGRALLALHRYPEASARYELAITIHEKTAEEEPDLVEALVGAGRAQTQARHAAAAIPLLERAVQLMAKTERTGLEGQRLLAEAQLALAEALVTSGLPSRSPRVEELARAALAGARAAKKVELEREAQGWMSENGLPL